MNKNVHIQDKVEPAFNSWTLVMIIAATTSTSVSTMPWQSITYVNYYYILIID